MRRGLLIHSSSELVTVAESRRPRGGGEAADLRVIQDGAVACMDGAITAVGATRDVRSRLATDRALADVAWDEVDCTRRCVTPGLVDAHTHLPFAGSRETELTLRQRGATYLDILAGGGGILSTVAATRAASEAELGEAARAWLDMMLADGVTTIEAKSGYGLEADSELRQLRVLRHLSDEGPIEIVPTLLAAHATPAEYDGRPDAYVDELAVPLAGEAARAGLARFVDAFCEEGVFTAEQSRRAVAAGVAAGLVPRLHADELRPSGGAQLAAEIGAASADHLGAVDEAGIRALAAADGATVATLLPVTSLYLGLEDAPARTLIEAGVPVAIGTDFNPGTSPSPSLALAMSLARIRLRMTAEEVLMATTINAAAALRMADRIGSLEAGKQADLVVWRVPRAEQIPYWIGAPLVDRVVKRGKVVFAV
ncbi:MAG: imidazolonepropionase [Candidatus Limnocylindria bacterium]